MCDHEIFFSVHLNHTDSSSYFFRVRARDDANNTGQWSNVVSATFVDPTSLEYPVTENKDTCF